MSEKKINDGGAAFPIHVPDEQGVMQGFTTNGMTLRDYFAAKAMQGLLANGALIDTIPGTHADWIASQAHLIADAMLKAREQANS